MRVRTESGKTYTGRLGALDDDSLVVDRTRRLGPAHVAVGDVAMLETRVGTETHPWKGALVGMTAGAAIGGIIGFGASNDDNGWGWDAEAGLGLMGLFGLVGGFVGLIVGGLNESPQWQAVDQPWSAATIDVYRDGVDIGWTFPLSDSRH